MLGHNSDPAWVRNPSGWVAINRDVRDHPLVGHGLNVPPHDPSRGSSNRGEAWQDLIMLASFKPQAVVNRGRTVMLDIGQLVGARSWLANRWNWSEKTVRWFLHALAEDGMITWSNRLHEQGGGENRPPQGPATGPAFRPAQGPANRAPSENACNVITICNYMDYQFALAEIKSFVAARRGQQTDQQEGQQKGHNLTKETLDKIPPTPKGGEGEEPFKLDGEPVEKGGISKADIAEAYRCYNVAAKHLKLADCRTQTAARTKLLARRLKDIGGIEAFKIALNQIRHDPFLAGRVPGRNGQDPFRMSIDTLLSARLGGVGDVLGRLLDLAAERASKAVDEDGTPRASEEELAKRTIPEWINEIHEHANGKWLFSRLGPSPASDKCKVPPELRESMRLADYYNIVGKAKDGVRAPWWKEKH